MTAQFQAIETVYRGYRFRSRLEARWAVFFDALKIRWEFEPQGYQLPELGFYLPDFFLPELDCFVEIKGPAPTPDEIGKARALALGTSKDVFVLWGAPGDYPDNSALVFSLWESFNLFGGAEVRWDERYAWHRPSSRCSLCRRRPDPPPKFDLVYDSPEYFDPAGEVQIQLAYEAARGARFEHGERLTMARRGLI